ncbi:MAG: TonB-dependent receptor [Rhodothermaceae bacterium]|nr:TonB-dependent receptor [Rhodothermaceae bacterium]
MPLKLTGFFFLVVAHLFLTHNLFAQVTASISGYVEDETEAPLPGATVYLQNTTLGATTNADGFFTIPGVTPGTYNLVASFVGFESQTKFNIQVKSVGNQLYSFTLIEATQLLEGVVVTPDRNVVSRPRETPLSTQTLTSVELATYPGGNNDVVQVAQSLPGITPSPGGFRNDLIIRGGAPNETVYYLDGVEIPNINHFSTQGSSGGPVGMINVSFIDEVTLSTSAFGAQYDNPLSGVLQFNQREGDRTAFNTNLRVSASETALTLNGPLFKGDKSQSSSSFMASVRRSYLQFLFELIGLPIRPDYWDYQYKFTFDLDEYNAINLIGVGSIDDFALEAGDDFDEDQIAVLDQAPFIEQQTNTIGLTWKKRFRERTGFMQTTISNNILINDFSLFEDNASQTGLLLNNDARESETKLRYNLTLFEGDWKFQTGFNLQHSAYTNTTIDLNQNLNFSTEIDFFKYGLYANATTSYLNNALDISVGIRLDDDTFVQGTSLFDTFSPRVALSYAINEQWKVNTTVGRYFKLPPYTILGYRENGELLNEDVDYTESNHYVIGIQRAFGPASSLSLEGFFKHYNKYPVSVREAVSLANQGADFEVLGNEEVETVGKGRSYGLELLFQQKLNNNFYGIFSYTYYYSEFTGFDLDRFIPSTWDSRHLASFTGGYKLPRNWEISARFRFAGKTPFAPTDLEATLDTYPEIVLDYNRLGETLLDEFAQLDVRFDKKWNLRGVSLDVFLEIQNVLAQSQPQPTEYILARDMNGAILTPRMLQALGPDEGAFVPVIGLVIDF